MKLMLLPDLVIGEIKRNLVVSQIVKISSTHRHEGRIILPSTSWSVIIGNQNRLWDILVASKHGHTSKNEYLLTTVVLTGAKDIWF